MKVRFADFRPSRTVRSHYLQWLMVAAFGCLVFIEAFGFRALSSHWISWLYSSSREQYQSAWLAYRTAPWSFPLGRLPLFFYPHGSTVAFMDGAPWYLTTLKLFGPLLPTGFSAWGWWIAACCLLQAVAGRALMEQITESEVSRWIGTLLIGMAPVFIQRNVHFSLMAHWLLLCAWAIFFRVKGAKSSPSNRWLWVLLIGVVSGIHPYLTAMIVTIRLGDLVFSSAAMRSRLTDLALTLATLGLVLFIFGYLDNGSTTDVGADRYSADLGAFVISQNTSSLLPSPPFGEGEQEGYAYLGAGGIVLAIGAALGLAARFWSASQNNDSSHFGVIQARFRIALGLSLAMLLFAFGPNFRLFGAELGMSYAHGTAHPSNPLFRYLLVGPLSKLPQVFRAPGRFTWPLYYLLIGFGARFFGRWPKICIAILAVQLIDIGPYVSARHTRIESYQKPAILREVEISHWVRNASIIKFLPLEPREACGLKEDPEAISLLKATLPIVASRSIPLNSGLQARIPRAALTPLCERAIDDFQKTRFHRGDLYIVDNSLLSAPLVAKSSRLECRRFTTLSICVQKRDLSQMNGHR